MFNQIPQLFQDSFQNEQLQKNLIAPINDLFKKNPFIDGNYIKDVVLTTGTAKAVPHLLQRKYQGYFITKINANSAVWVSSSDRPELFVYLSCSANCTVDLWVF